MVLRNWIIDYFIGEVEEVSKEEEIGFYVVMGMPIILVGITVLLMMWMGG